MRPYEIAVIFDATLEEDVIRDMTNQVAEFVRTRGGQPGRIDRWGRRSFAYEVRHRSEGYYVFIEVTAEPETMAEANRMLSLADQVLRHRVIRQPDRVAGRNKQPQASPQSSPAPVS